MSVVLRYCRPLLSWAVNSFVLVGLLFSEIIIVSLQPFFLGISMSDGRRNSSFMPHFVGREIAGLTLRTLLWTLICAAFFYLLSQPKTALHVQRTTPYAKLTYILVRVQLSCLFCCLNTRQHYTLNTLHERYIHVREHNPHPLTRTAVVVAVTEFTPHFTIVFIRLLRLSRSV